MPKQSKVNSVKRSRPSIASPVNEIGGPFYCTRCGHEYKNQTRNFPASQSPIFRKNNRYLPVCGHCVDEMFEHYKDYFGDEKAAIRRICLKFDIYWNEKIYDMVYKANTTGSRVLAYISKSNLHQFLDKTYDDTLDEEDIGMLTPSADMVNDEMIAYKANTQDDDSHEAPVTVITDDIMDFWGRGLPSGFYPELERRFRYWVGDEDRDEMDVGECAVIKQICILEVTINRDSALGKSIDRNVNALNTLLGSANLKPVQKKRDEDGGLANDMTPFGVWIRKIENTRPISEPDPEFKDIDGIVKYISIWFFGHLCKILKIKNTYSRLYEEEMSRLRVERPEYEGEDEDTILEDIFERASAEEAKSEHSYDFDFEEGSDS